MNVFYQPEGAVLGDVIPFFDEGRFKPFYLRNFRHARDEAHRDGWVMLDTGDHVHFSENDTGIAGGTGSVILVDGAYHMFYCTFHQNPERNYVQHAASRDLRQWTTLPEHAFRSDDRIYAPVHWRDPFVFWHEGERCWWMLVAAQRNGSTSRRGCVGLCKSDDLESWRYCEPLYAPMDAQCAFECPDLFHWNGWYYLVYSSYADRFQTLYRMSRSLDGPWLAPRVDTFDTRAFYAAKTGTDGTRRLIYGWNPTRELNERGFDPEEFPGRDCNTWDWGGALIVHELHQNQDGTLRVEPLPEVLDAFGPPVPGPGLRSLSGVWTTGPDWCVADAENEYAALLLGPIPETCRLSMDVRFEGESIQLGFALRVDEGFDRGYYLVLDPARGRMEYRTHVRMTERGGQMFPYEVEMERPLALDPGRVYHIELLVDGSVLEAYVDGVALGTRMFDLKLRQAGLFASNGRAWFERIHIHTGF